MKRVIAMVITLGLAFTLFSFNVNADTVNVQFDTYKYDVYLDDYIKCFIACQALYPVAQAENPYVGNTTSGQAITTWKMIVSVALTNLTSSTRRIPSGGLSAEIKLNSYSIQGYDYNFNALVGIENFGSDFYMTNYRNNGIFDFYPSTDFGFMEGMVIPANCTLTAISVLEFPCIDIRGDLHHASLNSVKINVAGSSETDFCPPGSHQDVLISLEALRNYLISNNGIPLIDSDLDELNQTVHDLYDLINDNLGSASYDDTIDDSNDLQTTEDQVHQQEQQWYADNKTAIEATGLGNYQYSPGLIDSFGVARYQIAMLWNALGDWTYVYYLVFLLGLAVYILRHEPTMRVKQMRADREARMQENQIYTNASRNVRMSRDADYARHVAWGFKSRRK